MQSDILVATCIRCGKTIATTDNVGRCANCGLRFRLVWPAEVQLGSPTATVSEKYEERVK